MLTLGEENYLSTIPPDKRANIVPYNPHIKEVAGGIMRRIKELYPHLDVIHVGASGLGISGQGDIDMCALSPQQDYDRYLPGLMQIFGEPKSRKKSVGWELIRGNIPIEFYLTDPSSPDMQRQLAVFEKLRSNPKLLREYEQLKESMNGWPLREYQRRKYEFYHKILDENLQ